jgi:hypothetical protein
LEEIKNDNIDIYKLCDEINNTIIVMTTDMNTVQYLDIDNLKSELKKRIVVVNDLFSFAFAYGINNIKKRMYYFLTNRSKKKLIGIFKKYYVHKKYKNKKRK